MKILITGGTGFIGKEIGKKLSEQGHDLILVTRDIEKAKKQVPFFCQWIEADLVTEVLRHEVLATVDAVIHLMGENIGDGKWSEDKKTKIYESRVRSTQNLIQSFSDLRLSPKVFISTSATGFYGHRGDEELSEESAAGSDFLSNVCIDWERPWEIAAHKKTFSDRTRIVILRLGVVMSWMDGAFLQMIKPIKLGVASPLASGKQWLSWVHIDDVCSAMLEALEKHSYKGVYNLVSPQPVTNYEFTATCAKILNQFLLPSTPGFILKAALGEMSTLVLSSQKVMPNRLLQNGFEFKFYNLEILLQDIFRPYTKYSVFYAEQFIPQTIDKVFNFFSQAKNLEKITPPMLNFHVKKMSTPEIEKGTLIDYKLKVHGIPVSWRTEITDWYPPFGFVDLQLKGPYSYWHHTHTFTEVKGGTLMTDKVLYKVPMGLAGSLLAGPFVQADIKKIFNFRRQFIYENKFN